ncbi:MAG: recombinase family protein, partial [Pseudomonadota bacterium]
MIADSLAQSKIKHAVIYCRVSSTKQLDEGDGLSSQQHRCEDYAKRKGYSVVKVFQDRGVSGGMIDRPGMQELLGWLLAQGDEKHVVIVDDISRFSRDVTVHWQLRDLLEKAGGRLESPTMTFGHSSDDKLVENLLASVSQHQREKIAETSANRMKARISSGYWVFRTVPGYKYIQTKGEGKVLVRDEPVASIVIEALEGFASGRFARQSDVKRFLEAQPEFPIQKSYGGIRLQKVTDILTHPLYAGMVQAVKWGISLRQGNHEALISTATFEKIQERLNEKAYAPRRTKLAKKFVLGGFVNCADCEKPMRSCDARSGTGRLYSYYLCRTKGCVSYGKSVRKDDIEGKFRTLIKSMRPTPGAIAIVKAMFADAGEQRAKQAEISAKALKDGLKRIERDVDRLVDMIADASSPHTARAYERKIDKLEEDKLLTEKKLADLKTSNKHLPEKVELALKFLSNPCKIWDLGDQDIRRLLLKMMFADRISYDRKTGYRTPQTSVIFKFFG